MKYRSIKTYGTDLGLSCCFRQWRAEHSHCSLLHGYSIGVRLTFEADILDKNNWAYDFGNCKWIKDFLVDTFDHKTIVAEDDPKKLLFKDLEMAGVLKLTILPSTGCEKFAEYIYEYVSAHLLSSDRVQLISCEVFEHGANSGVMLK